MNAYGATDLQTERLGDIEVAYTRAGDGPRVVMLHGLAQDHRMWAEQQSSLRDLETFAYDLRGHGATTLGEAVEVAYGRMESLEHSARILLAARLLGRVRTLTAEQVRDLVVARDGARRRGPRGGGMPPGDGLETE